MASQEQRERTMLPVKVHGSNARGQPYSEMAYVTALSQNGVRLEGAQCVAQLNEIITLEHQDHKVQFRVLWIGDPGTRLAGSAGLQTLRPMRVMFGVELPPPGPDTFDPTIPPGAPPQSASGVFDRRVVLRRLDEERRKFPRYRCTGSAELRSAGSEFNAWGKLSDISMGGCYVETASPLPVGTEVEGTVSIGDQTISTRGGVRSSHPGVGMGIEFLDLAPDQKEALSRVIEVLSGGVPPPRPKIVTPPPAPVRPAPSPAVPALEPLVQWFLTHETLNRTDFLRLIEQRKEDEQKSLAS